MRVGSGSWHTPPHAVIGTNHRFFATMCIVPGNGAPKSTRLFTMPATFDGKDATVLMYLNDMGLSEDATESAAARTEEGREIAGWSAGWSGASWRPVFTYAPAPKAARPAVMIVPFPNPTRSTVFGLLDSSTFKAFTGAVQDAFPRPVTASFGFDGMVKGARNEARLAPVLRVGNYNISVVPTALALMENVDWSKFHVGTGEEARVAFFNRLSVISDSSVVPEDSGFVVAEAVLAVKDGGFGLVYPGTHAFLPTCHEASAAPVEYDVECYVIGGTIPSIGGVLPQSVILPHSVLDTFPSRTFGNGTNLTAGVIVPRDSLRRVPLIATRLVMKERFHNQNVMGCFTCAAGSSEGLAGPPEAPRATSLPETSEMDAVVRHGRFFSPAAAHYISPAVVVCDWCRAKNLTVCIGWGSRDLCLKCATDAPWRKAPAMPMWSPSTAGAASTTTTQLDFASAFSWGRDGGTSPPLTLDGGWR